LVGAEGFWTSPGAGAYTLMGSFFTWFVDIYGIDAALAAYPSGDFEGACGEPIDALVSKWERFIDAVPLHEDVLPIARYYFDTPTIFDRVCARYTGALLIGAGDHAAERRLAEAEACLREVAALQPDNPGAITALASIVEARGRY